MIVSNPEKKPQVYLWVAHVRLEGGELYGILGTSRAESAYTFCQLFDLLLEMFGSFKGFGSFFRVLTVTWIEVNAEYKKGVTIRS